MAPHSALGRGSFYDLAAAVTSRYGAKGSFWSSRRYRVPASVRARYLQIWNEPNIGSYWNRRPEPGAYANLLRGASSAANRADPATRIIAGGLPWSKGIQPEDFLRSMFTWKEGAVKSYVDAVAVHPYAPTPALMAEKVRSTRRTLNALKVYRPVWLTEMGWATGAPDGRFQVSEQAAYLKDAYSRLLASKRSWNVGHAFWFNLSDQAGRSWYYRTGLFRRDGRAKPSWLSLRQVTGKG